MSVFSNWSHSVRASMASAGFRVSLGQVHQILSAGLGHASFASFKVADQVALESAAYAVFDIEGMQRRAHAFPLQLKADHYHDMISKLDKARKSHWPQAAPLDSFGWVVRLLIEDEPHPAKLEICKSVGGQPNNSDVVDLDMVSPIEKSPCEWKWHASGFMNVVTEFDHRVPFKSEVIYPKLGLHLLGPGHISQYEQCGETQLYDADYPAEFDPQGIAL